MAGERTKKDIAKQSETRLGSWCTYTMETEEHIYYLYSHTSIDSLMCIPIIGHPSVAYFSTVSLATYKTLLEKGQSEWPPNAEVHLVNWLAEVPSAF
jgi:hypothetical protein